MIFSRVAWLATSVASQGSERLPQIAKDLAPLAREVLEGFRHTDEIWLDISTVLVAIGVILEVFEIVHELREKVGPFKFSRPEMPKWMVWAGFAGWLMIVIGVAGEFWFEGAVSTRTEELESVSSGLLTDAELSSAEATKQAGDAKTSAQFADDAADDAQQKADAADTAASNALNLASGARTEADSFEHEIVSANEKATAAEQHLAEALREATAAQAELNRIRSPRSVSNEPSLVSSLFPFRGTEYTLETNSDTEAIELTKSLDRVLNNAGWIRKQPTAMAFGLTYFKVFDDNTLVPACIEIGIWVHIQSKVPVETLRSTPWNSLPRPVQAAGTLRGELGSHIAPFDERNVGNLIEPDKPQQGPPVDGPLVICVGRKP